MECFHSKKHKSAFVDMAMIYVVHVHIVMQQANVAIEILWLFVVIFKIESLLQATYSYFTISLAYLLKL
jgi:hypothetical protein